MKSFSYTWNEDIFLLHVESNNAGCSGDYLLSVIRRFSGGNDSRDIETVKNGTASYRFMISRSSPEEAALLIEYPDESTIKVYELDDRAYYPTKPLFEG